MKQWIAAVATGCALVAVWRLPPEAGEWRTPEVKPAEQIRFEELVRRQRVTSEVLRRMLWADSLSALAVREARDGVALLTPDGGPAVADQRERLADRLHRQVEERRGQDRSVLFAYVIQPHDQGGMHGPGSARERTETFAGTRDGVDYCMQVRVALSRYWRNALAGRLAGNDDVAPRTTDLGACRFYVAHGLPGAGVERWLEEGGIELAFESGEQLSTADGRHFGRRGPFGLGSVPSGAAVPANRCKAGIAGGCAAFLGGDGGVHPLLSGQPLEIARRSPAVAVATGVGHASWFHDQAYLLADLEAEFGREAFGRFWTSDAGFEHAFEEAFGVDAGTWMVSWVDRTLGVDEPGPGVPRRAASTSMLAMVALLGVAYWRRRERTVVR